MYIIVDQLNICPNGMEIRERLNIINHIENDDNEDTDVDKYCHNDYVD